jgi:hypothetical protein
MAGRKQVLANFARAGGCRQVLTALAPPRIVSSRHPQAPRPSVKALLNCLNAIKIIAS